MALQGLDPYLIKSTLQRAAALADLSSMGKDVAFLRSARRALLPLPFVDKHDPIDTNVFPPFKERPIEALAGKRIGLVASGGSGACVSLVGVKRAFEEAGVQPVVISSCSGGA